MTNWNKWSWMLLWPVLVSCATGSSIRTELWQPRNPVAESQRIDVGVLRFDTSDLDELDEEEQNIRRFEQNYFSARLIERLRQSPFVRSAYYIPAPTPAVDFMFKGSIKESSGEKLSVKLAFVRFDGHRVFQNDYAIDLRSRDFETTTDPAATIWIQPVDDMAKALGKGKPHSLSPPLATARLATYAGSSSDFVETANPLAIDFAEHGAGVERESLLAALTKPLMQSAAEVKEDRITWERETTELRERKRRGRRSAFIGVLGALAAIGGSAVDSYYSTQAGLTPNTNIYTESAMSAAMYASKSSSKASAASNSAEELMSAFENRTEQLTVEVEGAIVRLSGNYEERLTQFRAEMRRRLNAILRGETARIAAGTTDGSSTRLADARSRNGAPPHTSSVPSAQNRIEPLEPAKATARPQSQALPPPPRAVSPLPRTAQARVDTSQRIPTISGALSTNHESVPAPIVKAPTPARSGKILPSPPPAPARIQTAAESARTAARDTRASVTSDSGSGLPSVPHDVGYRRVDLEPPAEVLEGTVWMARAPRHRRNEYVWYVNDTVMARGKGLHAVRYLFKDTGTTRIEYREIKNGLLVSDGVHEIRVVPEAIVTLTWPRALPFSLQAPAGFKKHEWRIDNKIISREAELSYEFVEAKTYALECIASEPSHDKVAVAFRRLRYAVRAGGPFPSTSAESQLPALHGAARAGHEEIVKNLLRRKLSDVNGIDKFGLCALHWAAWAGETDIVRFLLKQGASVQCTDPSGTTPLDVARWRGNEDIIEILQKQL